MAVVSCVGTDSAAPAEPNKAWAGSWSLCKALHAQPIGLVVHKQYAAIAGSITAQTAHVFSALVMVFISLV